MSETTEQYRQRLLQVAKERGDFVLAEDGFWVYWPTHPHSAGAIASPELRILADELDRLNKPWQEQMDKFFGGPEHHIVNADSKKATLSEQLDVLRRIAERGLKEAQNLMDIEGVRAPVDCWQHMLDEVVRTQRVLSDAAMDGN